MDALQIQKKMITEGKSLMLTRLQELWDVKKEEFERQIQEASEQILAKIAALQEIKKRYLTAKEQKEQNARDLKREFKTLKKDLRSDWRRWNHLTSTILKA